MSDAATTEKSLLNSPTSSRSVTETVNGSHKFVIQGYSLAKGMGIGKHIASDNFTVGGYQWAIYFYPDGKNPEDNSTYVSVFIALASEGTDVRALFELTLVDQSGKGKHKVHSHFDRSLESGPYTLKYRGSMWSVISFTYSLIALLISDRVLCACCYVLIRPRCVCIFCWISSGIINQKRCISWSVFSHDHFAKITRTLPPVRS